MINDILDILFQYGWFFLVFSGVAIVLSRFIAKNWEKWFESEEKEEIDEDSLKYHNIFSNAQYRFLVEIPNLQLIPGKPVRESIFKDLLKICFNSIYAMVNEFVSHEDLNSWDEDKWVSVMTESVNKMVINTEVKARENGIPEIVIRKFMEWHLESIDSLHEHILILGSSRIYNTNVIKTNTLLMIMNLLLITILGDAERVLKEINGELTGINYKGLIIE